MTRFKCSRILITLFGHFCSVSVPLMCYVQILLVHLALEVLLSVSPQSDALLSINNFFFLSFLMSEPILWFLEILG